MTATAAPGLTFQRRNHGRGHSYWLNGQKLPGVTTILGEAIRARALENWAAEVTAKTAVDRWDELAALPVSARLDTLTRARWEQRDAAALAGTKVHECAWGLVIGDEVDVPAEHAGQVEAVARWLDSWHVEPVDTESPVFNATHGWAGTFDLLAGIGGTLWLLDYKTGKGVYADAALQLAAYGHAEWVQRRDGGIAAWQRPERTGVVHITADSATLYPTDSGDAAYTVFRYCQQVARWAMTVAEARKAGESWPIGAPLFDPEGVAS